MSGVPERDLIVLPDDHPCSGCRASCCDPVWAALDVAYVPLPVSSGRQPAPARIVDRFAKEIIIPDIRERASSQLKSLLSECPFFHLKGYLADVDPRHQQVMMRAMDGGAIDGAGIVRHQINIALVQITVMAFLDCDRFHRKQRICTDYVRRPEDCRTGMTPETCGRSLAHFSQAEVDKAVEGQRRWMLNVRTKVADAVIDYLKGRQKGWRE